MKNSIVLIYLSMFFMQPVFSQNFKTGDKAEALINNSWKPVTIVKIPVNNNTIYQVKVVNTQTSQNAIGNIISISKDKLRIPKPPVVTSPVIVKYPVLPSNLHLGRYELYSGIPTMYLGHILLMADGQYKTAFSTDEDNYEIGTYGFNNETSSIEWITGVFKNNNWGGKLVKRSANNYRIEFNKATFADSN